MSNKLLNIIKKQKDEIRSLLGSNLLKRTQSRILQESLNSSLIKIITGPRRAGKSTLAIQVLKSKSFCYLNFEDESIPKIEDGDEILKALSQVYGNTDFYFFDEIQNLDRWEPFLNRMHRLGKNIIATGSNSKLLGEELSSSLTGRHIQIEVLPFSFKEISQSKEPNQNTFKQYLTEGGFPEITINKVDHRSYLTTLWDSVILKDIAKRKKIRNISGLNNTLSLVLSGITSRFSFDSLAESLQQEISAPTVKKFISYANEAYLVSDLNLFNFKPKKRIKSDKKAYTIDNGFYNSKNINLSEDYGKLLENSVFTELRIRGFIPNLNLFYYITKSGFEVDFILRDGHRNLEAIQVCYSVSALKTKERELRALFEVQKELGIKKLKVVTFNEDSTETYKNIKIEIIPAIKWFME